MADFKEMRKKQKLTQSQLAELLDVTVNTIQNWENGRSLPSGENLNKYLKALGVTSQVDITRIVGEINTASYNESNADDFGNMPVFLFPDDSEELKKVKQCFATAEELDMLGYAEYVSWNGKYSKIDKRGDTRYPLEFAFFEKYGGYNATRKKMADARCRLGGLYIDALEFAEENPGLDYRITSFDRETIIDKIGLFLRKDNYRKDIHNLYNMMKTIESVGTDSNSNLMIRLEKGKEIARILQNSIDYMTGERNLGCLEGYVFLEEKDSKDRPNISMLRLTERGKQLIQWGDINNYRI